MKRDPEGVGERRKIEIRDGEADERPAATAEGEAAEPDGEFRVEDRRHWTRGESDAEERAGTPPRAPTVIDEYRQRAEAAERQLQEYIEAFKGFKRDQEDFRDRLNRDVDRRVELKFGGLVETLLEVLDDLDLALAHVEGVPEAEPLARGVEMARRRFLDSLERSGVERIDPAGNEFDPNESEALRVDAVSDAALSGTVTEVLRPGYRLGDRVIRPARVAVGRHSEA